MNVHWWPQWDPFHKGIGLHCGITQNGPGWGGAAIDLLAVAALCKVRTDEALELKQLLDSLQKPETGSEHDRAGPP